MSARVEASRDGGAVLTVEGNSAYGTGAIDAVWLAAGAHDPH